MGYAIYDVDGTLTYVFGDVENTTKYGTYAFYDLLTEYFTTEKKQLEKAIARWREDMRTESKPTQSSFNMMQHTISTFKEGVTSWEIRAYAELVTLDFIQNGVIRYKAIQHMKQCILAGHICILSTGGLEEGVEGFLDALVAKDLLSQVERKSIIVSGAMVDWENKQLLHANVRELKVVGIQKKLNIMSNNRLYEVFKPSVIAVFGDDPLINDKGILALAPKGKAYVIETNKNAEDVKALDSDYEVTTWDKIVANTQPCHTEFFDSIGPEQESHKEMPLLGHEQKIGSNQEEPLVLYKG